MRAPEYTCCRAGLEGYSSLMIATYIYIVRVVCHSEP